MAGSADRRRGVPASPGPHQVAADVPAARDVETHRRRAGELRGLAEFGMRLVMALCLRVEAAKWLGLETVRVYERLTRGVLRLTALEARLEAALRLSDLQRLAERARCAAAASLVALRQARRAEAPVRLPALVVRTGSADVAEADERFGDPLKDLPPDCTVSEFAAAICKDFGITPEMPDWPAALIAMDVKLRDLDWAAYGGLAASEGNLAAGPHPPVADATGPSLSRAAGEGNSLDCGRESAGDRLAGDCMAWPLGNAPSPAWRERAGVRAAESSVRPPAVGPPDAATG